MTKLIFELNTETGLMLARFALPDSTNPVTQAFGDSASPGTATKLARIDHVHGMPDNPVTIVLKANDEKVNNSSALQNDDELLLPVGANDVWHFLVWLRYDTGTTPDIKFSFAVPSGGWMTIISSGRLAASTEGTGGTPIISYGAGDVIIAPGAGGERQFLFWCYYHGGGTAGNVQLQWAQNVANASDTIIYSRSHIIAFQIT